MSYTLFISDLHLCKEEPSITREFKNVLTGPAQHADELYILGDFFESWIGDDDDTPFNRDIIQALKHFTHTTKIPTFFMRGNRDFLIGKRFEKQTGVQLIQDPTSILLYGKRVLLLHGDILCTLDVQYQSFRKKRSTHWFKGITFLTPLQIRRKIAKKMREKSKAHQQNLSDRIMDVTPAEVARVFEKYKPEIMIHGHTHRPMIHDGSRIVLGAWHEQASLLYFYDDKPPFLGRI